MDKTYNVTAFYKFHSIPEAELAKTQSELLAFGDQQSLCGLILLASEGINGTVAGTSQGITELKKKITSLVGDTTFKDSVTTSQPFKRYKVKIKSEIAAIGDPGLIPNGPNHHLSPKQWNDVLTNNEPVAIIDVRNTYESDLGRFKGAICPKLDKFNEFPNYVRELNLPKDAKILTYCTGGIRCEKAVLEMQRAGYKNTYQLDGGILQYLQEFPDQHFEGECFVFDHRVAVDQTLLPSNAYDLCPHCGDPGKELTICKNCGKETTICDECGKEDQHHTCSKNCRHHYLRNNTRYHSQVTKNTPTENVGEGSALPNR